LATILAKKGFTVQVFEKRPDMRKRAFVAGRSINLVLTRRGLAALEGIDMREKVLELTVPVLGRMMHSLSGELTYQAYGKDDYECNYSVSRDQLNAALLDAAEAAGVQIQFDAGLVGADLDAGKLYFDDREVDAGLIFGTDGAPSLIRKALVERTGYEAQIEMMAWGYKEVLFPAAPDGSYPLAEHALHIWPRGHHFLMGLANLAGSFTGTLYLPLTGADSFESLQSPEDVQTFFEKHYPDAIPLLAADYAQALIDHPLGSLGTVRCTPWHLDAKVLILGDASHGIVPFFGQGLNSGFEDCSVLASLLEEHGDFETIFSLFSAARKPNTDAIADMALENFVEMSELVGDPEFLKRKSIEARLTRELPGLYRSRYALVMYSHIPYRAAFEIGQVQKEILLKLSAEYATPDEVDLNRARGLIEEKLSTLYARYDVDLES
jgi:kynurenine 3-monooxygenase